MSCFCSIQYYGYQIKIQWEPEKKIIHFVFIIGLQKITKCDFYKHPKSLKSLKVSVKRIWLLPIPTISMSIFSNNCLEITSYFFLPLEEKIVLLEIL